MQQRSNLNNRQFKLLNCKIQIRSYGLMHYLNYYQCSYLKIKRFLNSSFWFQISNPQAKDIFQQLKQNQFEQAYEYACAQIFQTEVSKFHEFIIDGNIPQIKKMLEGNKRLLNKCINQYPPLYHAVRCGHYDVTEFFLKAGCSMNFKNHQSTPMHCAAYYGYDNIIPLLFAYGIPTDIKNSYGDYPIQEAERDEIKQMLGKMKVNHIYKLRKELLQADLSHFSINISDKKTKKKVITKLLHKNYNSFYNNQQYDRALHGTLLSKAFSIMKFDLKKPGDQLQGRILQVCDGHISLRAKQTTFRGVQDWQMAVFVTPSIYYASNPAYSKEFTDNFNDVWLTIFEVRVKKGTYGEYEHTVGDYQHEKNQPINVQFRVEDPSNIKIVSVMLINKNFITSNRNYKEITNLIFNSEEENNLQNTCKNDWVDINIIMFFKILTLNLYHSLEIFIRQFSQLRLDIVLLSLFKISMSINDSFFIINNMGIPKKILALFALLFIVSSAVTVNQITGVSNDNLVYSGSIPISATGNLFFTYYGVDGQKDQSSLKNYPLFIFVGNPGSSAQYYSLGGIGPVKLNNDMTLSANPNRFTNTANLMFIDLLGSGFSFTTDLNELAQDGKTFGVQLTTAINTFVKESVLGQSSKIIIGGESTFIRSLPGLGDISALKGLIHFSIWPQIYAIGRFYGIAGVELKLYTESSRIAIDSTFTSCYNYIRSAKYLEGHQCLDTIFNFVEDRTKNTNLFDVRLNSTLTEFLPMIQYYFSQANIVSNWKAPNSRLFESQSGWISNKTYVDLAKNYTKDISSFMKDYFSVRHWFVQGLTDYISYFKGVRNWLQTELTFVESDAFKKAKLDDITIDGKIVGQAKAVKQVAYSEIIESGHHLPHDAPAILNPLFKSWVESLTEEEQNLSSEVQIATE